MSPKNRGKKGKGHHRSSASRSGSTSDLLSLTPLESNSHQTPLDAVQSFDPTQHEQLDEVVASSPISSESASSEADGDIEVPQPDGDVLHRPGHVRQTSGSSLGRSTPHAFAPPFYNRPPTPLPPSPSLTSLLRPPFSAQTSRPTTPDSSDAETPNDTEAVVAKSARTATTVPRASPKVPTYEYYGFALYLGSSLAFLIYLLWSYLPSPFLHQLGIHYYPNRWWSLAIPAYLVVTVLYIYVALASYNTGYLTLPMSSIENIVDETANIAALDSKGRVRLPNRNRESKAGKFSANTIGIELDGYEDETTKVPWRTLWGDGTNAVMDIPVGGVCEILYGDDRDPEWDDLVDLEDLDDLD
ncbi:PIG-P-domain-containing protein [Xylona heveae TC161]|uniref:PIG-P-domain-containing protein n=1 Tax=Xylona heveae (strain CBS 132557 / TC161) TaxID=1328760 RepID=A0A165HUV8_XYLHT|nr:PIG-P-domain-containing protein [Xylona heveae TC161]KZF23954.1 PIG-P-domain-containing protein [Xylona heveae TC161]